jgi:hypothetical protein
MAKLKHAAKIKGISFNAAQNLFIARINLKGRAKYLGSSRHLIVAARLRLGAEREQGNVYTGPDSAYEVVRLYDEGISWGDSAPALPDWLFHRGYVKSMLAGHEEIPEMTLEEIAYDCKTQKSEIQETYKRQYAACTEENKPKGAFW